MASKGRAFTIVKGGSLRFQNKVMRVHCSSYATSSTRSLSNTVRAALRLARLDTPLQEGQHLSSFQSHASHPDFLLSLLLGFPFCPILPKVEIIPNHSQEQTSDLLPIVVKIPNAIISKVSGVT